MWQSYLSIVCTSIFRELVVHCWLGGSIVKLVSQQMVGTCLMSLLANHSAGSI